MESAEERGPELGQLLFRQGDEVQLERFQVHHVQQGDVGQDRRNGRGGDDVDVRQPQELGHDEGRGPHDRGQELAVGAGAHLHRTGLVGRKAHPFHERDGEGAGGGHVGDGRSRHHAGQARCQHRGLGRSAAEASQHGEGHLHEVFRGPRPVQQRAEQHEQEHEIGGYPQRHAPDAAVREVHVVHYEFERDAGVRQKPRQVGADEAVEQEDRGQRRQRQPQGPPRRLQQQQDERRSDPHVPLQRQPRTLDDPHVVPGQVDGAAAGQRRDDEVVPRDLDRVALVPSRKQLLHQCVEALQRRSPPYGRKGQVDQQYGEGQVDAAGDDGVDGTVGDVELEQGPAERQHPEEPADGAAGRAGLSFALAQFGQRFEVDAFAGGVVTIGGIHGAPD